MEQSRSIGMDLAGKRQTRQLNVMQGLFGRCGNALN